jgi:hypothetical protein
LLFVRQGDVSTMCIDVVLSIKLPRKNCMGKIFMGKNCSGNNRSGKNHFREKLLLGRIALGKNCRGRSALRKNCLGKNLPGRTDNIGYGDPINKHLFIYRGEYPMSFIKLV